MKQYQKPFSNGYELFQRENGSFTVVHRDDMGRIMMEIPEDLSLKAASDKLVEMELAEQYQDFSYKVWYTTKSDPQNIVSLELNNLHAAKGAIESLMSLHCNTTFGLLGSIGIQVGYVEGFEEAFSDNGEPYVLELIGNFCNKYSIPALKVAVLYQHIAATTSKDQSDLTTEKLKF